MLEATLWITGFLLLLLLTWFLGRYCAERMAARKILRQRAVAIDDILCFGAEDPVATAGQQSAGGVQGRRGHLRLAARDGQILDPDDDCHRDVSIALHKASK